MSDLVLQVPHDEARALYRLVHQTPGGQDLLFQTYRQLQNHFFAQLTVEELTVLLEDEQ
jgi:hypothetical protein